MSNEVAIIIGSLRFVGWTSVRIRRSIETFANNFQLGLLDVWDDSLEYGIKPGDSCKVTIGDNTVITGFIDSFSPEIVGDDYTIQLSGRCKCSDLVDCSAMNKPGSWNRPIGLYDLVSALIKPFEIDVFNEAETLGEKIRDFSIDSGQSPFEAIRQACEMRAVLAISNVDGNVVLTNSGNLRATDSLAYSRNIIRAIANYNFSDRFSTYRVKGSSSSDGDGWSNSTVSVVGSSDDPTITRYRPKMILADSAVTTGMANTRAAWEAQVRAAKSAQISVSIAGWTQLNGSLWRENMIVYVDIPPLRINQAEMLIVQVIYTYDENGELTQFSLRRPDAYAPNPNKQVSKPKSVGNAGWE